ncbi:MAG: hypothetical protein E7011_04640 [Alphaproteobacteria bacterium]|nr:hypothetical protein [Alphaproteobacteria bacterium]
MKRLICFILITATLVPLNAIATTHCIMMSSNTVCTTSNDCYNTSDCTVSCDNVPITIIGRCSSTSGNADSSVAANISTSSTSSNNIWCWCTLVSPVTTRWVLRFQYSSASYCASQCGRGCRNAMIFDNDSDKNFRSTLFNNIIE